MILRQQLLEMGSVNLLFFTVNVFLFNLFLTVDVTGPDIYDNTRNTVSERIDLTYYTLHPVLTTAQRSPPYHIPCHRLLHWHAA